MTPEDCPKHLLIWVAQSGDCYCPRDEGDKMPEECKKYHWKCIESYHMGEYDRYKKKIEIKGAMNEHYQTLEQACKESKKQRKDDERRGYMRAVRRMRRFAENALWPYRIYEMIMLELKKMEKKG